MRKKVQLTFLVSVLITFASFLNAQETAKPTADQPAEFKPSGKVWGYVFGDYYLQMHADSAKRGSTQYAKTAKDYNAFAFRRVYLGYDYNISPNFSTELLIAHEGDTLGGQTRTFFLKAANLRWKNILPNNDLVIGQTSTPIFATVSEKVWGYRSIEKTIIDMRGLGKSNDLGIAWQGKLNDKGDYGYNFMVGNGTAQKLETDKYKKFYGEFYAKLMDQKIILDVTGDYEPSSKTQSKTTLHGFVAYQTDPFTAGIEIVTQTQTDAAVDTTSGAANAKNVNVTPFGISIFARGQIIPDKLNYFARFDNFNPDTKFDASIKYKKSPTNYSENFITAGVDFTPIKNVHFEPNIWIDTYNSLKKNVTGLAKSDYDMTARMTFYYVFK